ncbi:MAG: phosphoribosylformylglycinamidine synthase I, partial [Sedimentisphaerales bacterium]|nr:phosphoribosylformylglycinamidine synthase I [Sedimentisphaerales bacterium]
IVLRTAGTNCDEETCHAFGLAGAATERVHVNRLIEEPQRLETYQILVLPGGFSYGDDIAAGKILANQLVHHFRNSVRAFIDAGGLVLGICNGFQVLVKAGLLPALPDGGGDSGDKGDGNGSLRQATITYNDSGRFEDRWVYLEPATDKCVFIRPGERIFLPVAHGEGKVCFADEAILERVKAGGQVAFRYVDKDGHCGGFPVNPNGSTDHIAGLCDPTGRVLGLMPHPERHVHRTQHPCWTRDEAKHDRNGLSIFTNAIRYFA